MAQGRGAGEEALQLFDDVKSMAMELDAAWQMFIVPMSAFSQTYIRRVTSQKDKKAQTGKHEIWQMWEWKCKGHHLQLCTGRHGESWLLIFRRSALWLCIDMPFISWNWQGVSWTSFNGAHLLKENQKGLTAEPIHDDSILHELSHSQLCKQEKCRLDICLEDSSWDVLWRDLARQVRGHSYGHLARSWPRCLSVKAPSVWPFSWQQFGMYLTITLNDLQHVNCWPVSMWFIRITFNTAMSACAKAKQWQQAEHTCKNWSTMVVRGRGLALPTNPWNIQHGPTWTPNCSKLKGKSFSNYHDGKF